MISCSKALKLASRGFEKNCRKELKKLDKEINRKIKFECSIGLQSVSIYLDKYRYITEDEKVINFVVEKLEKKGYTVGCRKLDFLWISWKEESKE